MAQLSADCFAFGGPLLSVNDAVALAAVAGWVSSKAPKPWTSCRPMGRVLARDISAPLPLPPFTNSAVDGLCAARRGSAHHRGEGILRRRFRPGRRCCRRCCDGGAGDPHLHPARRCRPAPTRSSCRRTCVSPKAEKVALPPGLKRGANVRPMGEDIALGQVVLKAGQRLRPQDIGLAAALGRTRLEVRRRIRVAVFSTGNEIVSPGGPPRAGPALRLQPLHVAGDAGAPRLRSRRSRNPERRCRRDGRHS